MKRQFKVDFKTEFGHSYAYLDCSLHEVVSRIKEFILKRHNALTYYINITVREYNEQFGKTYKKVLFVSKAEIKTIVKFG